MRLYVAILGLALPILLGATTIYWPEEVRGGVAPGIEGSFATMETLQWIWNLDGVPFPTEIDEGQWTDYYFSATGSGGEWPEGDNNNDGFSPETAKRTLQEAEAVCFGGEYRRCNFDPGDTWNVAGTDDIVNGFGVIDDTDIIPGTCPVTRSEALKQPCFWLRSGSGANRSDRAHFDFTNWNVASTSLLAYEPVVDRAHLLIERIDMTCDSIAATVSTVCIDTFEAGILTYVGEGTLTVIDNVSGSGQIASAHHAGSTNIYGRVDLLYANASSTGSNNAIGVNGSGSMAVHISGVIEGLENADTGQTCRIIDIAQSGSAPDTGLNSEISGQPAYVLVTGAHLRTCDDAPAASPFVLSAPNNTSPNSNHTVAHFISVWFDNILPNVVSPVFKFQGLTTADALSEVVALYSTIALPEDGSTQIIDIGTTDIGSTADAANLTMRGVIVQTSGGDVLNPQHVRILDDDWIDNTNSVLIYEDWVHDDTDNSNDFFVRSASGDCEDTTATDLETCTELLRAGAVDITTGEHKIVADVTGTATGAGQSTTTLQDTSKTWATDEWNGCDLVLTGGQGDEQSRRITDTADTETITVSPALDTAPLAASTTYQIECMTNVGGYCYIDPLGTSSTPTGECVGKITQPDSDYDLNFQDERGYFPPFIAGKELIGFKADTATWGDAGRIRGDPWATR